MRTFIYALPLLFTLGISGCKKDKSNEIVIPANSVDALAKAIQDAEENGTIRLASGIHTESGTITIDKKVCIIGDDGAVLIVDTKPTLIPGEPLDPAVHFYGINGACIENIEIRPVDPIGGTGIILEQSNQSYIRKCKIYRHQYSIAVEASNDVIIENNIIEYSDGWQTGVAPIGHGILIINGKRVNIIGNSISKAFFGAWISDLEGIFNNNMVTDNYIGVVPCAIPDSSAVMPRSNVVYSMIPGSFWTIKNNTCERNVIGILLYDGASECIVENNDCKNNSRIDIELGKAWEIGEGALQLPFPIDRAKHNKVNAGSYTNIRVRDCGWSNQIIGVTPISDGDCF